MVSIGLDMCTKDLPAVPNALKILVRKYGHEHWFVSVESYGDNRIILYYKDTKNVPKGNGRFYHFAGVEVTWKKVP
jgi:hypothetical protein